MSAADLLKTAAASAHELTSQPSSRSFRRVAREFVDALARVTDHPAAEFSPLEVEQLSSTAEHVIAAIERRLDDEDDGSSEKHDLAEAIYDARRILEEISRWRRHYLQKPIGN